MTYNILLKSGKSIHIVGDSYTVFEKSRLIKIYNNCVIIAIINIDNIIAMIKDYI